MGEHVIKLPDVGEGVAEAELVEWHVKIGDQVRADDVLAAVMTDKATVEIPSPVDGRILWLAGEIGDQIAVGAPLIRLEIDALEEVVPSSAAEPGSPATPATKTAGEAGAPPDAARVDGGKPLASPAVRRRARESGVDLGRLTGSGPGGLITHDDLDLWLRAGGECRVEDDVTSIKMVGLRRKIAARMTLAKRRIPHITYVEEVDVTDLEALRAELNARRDEAAPKLTVLPFLARALVLAIEDHPEMNARYDDEAEVVERHGAVHLGIATQTPDGLMVPVVNHAETLDLRAMAQAIGRLAEAARKGRAARDDLSGSTITISSLGALGGIVSTPVINHPEVAIVGVNKIAVRPVWDGAAFVPRQIMNLSSSFDHRVVDGWNAAAFIQRIKSLLETPAGLGEDAK